MKTRLLLALLSLTLSAAAHAGKAHVHGEGSLEVVIDKDQLSFNLELPMDVAVGFERAPKTDKEKDSLAAAAKALNDGANVFVPTAAAECVLTSTRVSLPEFGKAAADAHVDIDATYVFRCAKPAALKGFETSLFKQFKRLYRLEAQRIGPSGQGKGRMSPKQPGLSW